MKRWKRGIALLCGIMMVLSCTGCKEEVQVPELLAPMESKNAVYIVKESDMKEVSALEGSVVPVCMDMMFEYSTTVENVQVQLGDKVKAGDVLFDQNPDAEERKLEISIELETLEKSYELTLQQFNDRIKQMEKQAKAMRNAGDRYGASLMDIQVKEQKLRFEHDNASTVEAIAERKEELALVEEQLTMIQVKAPCDGTIVYISVEDDGDAIEEEEVFLTIAKDAELRLRCPYIEEETYAKLTDAVAQIGATKYEVNYIAYTEEELYEMEESGGPTHSYFTVENLAEEVSAGDYALFTFTSEKEEAVISVPKDSVHKSGKEYYVTVIEGTTMTERAVKVGKSSLNEIEIVEGLNVGEKVFIAKDLARYGVTYETVKATLANYSKDMKAIGAERYATEREPFVNPVPGTITEIFIPTFSEVYVEEGQQLYIVEPSIDKADWEQTKFDLKNFKESYAEEKERRVEEIEEYEKSIKKIKNKLEKELAQLNLNKMKENYEEYIEESEEQIAYLTERVDNYEKWSEGAVTICAEKTGVISSFASYTVGDKLQENEQMCEFYDPDSYIIRFADDENLLRYGMEVIFSSKVSGETIELSGRVVSASDVHPKGKDEAIVLLDEMRYLEANNVGTIIYPEYNLSDVLIVDAHAVYTDATSEEEEMSLPNQKPEEETGGTPYVWVYDSEGCAVKRYLSTVATVSGGYWVCDGITAQDVILIH